MDWPLFLIFLGASVAAGASGALFPPGAWYDRLSKPRWTPPDWLFPVAWTYLYLAMAFAATRVAPMDGAEYALAFYALQIALNTLWTPVFFGLHNLRAALGVVAALWLAVAATLAALWPLDALAFWVMSPYLVWVSIAAALNAAILWRNPAPAPA